MYIPPINRMDDQQEILNFIQRFSFGTIITVIDQVPVATQLPFISNLEDGKLIIRSHFAKANPQWKHIEENRNLLIFTEPHAYISPKNYIQQQNVPTWNYITVHAYGKAELMTDDQEAFKLLEQTINFYEQEYLQQWESLDQGYREKLVKGIVGFKIEVDQLEAKQKLSQNRAKEEQENIINQLGQSPNTADQLIADYMQKNICKND